MKLTKRKAFNFLRSYFDVLNELKTDKDRLEFLTAIINKQFLNEEPEDMSFIVNLCYQSQRHQIESSVKGWERATNDTLVTTPPTTPPTPKQEEEEKGEEEEKEEQASEFDLFWNLYDKKTSRVKCETKFNKLSKSDKQKIFSTLPAYIKSTPDKQYRKDPSTYLNNKSWNDEVEVIVPRKSNEQIQYENIMKQVNQSKL